MVGSTEGANLRVEISTYSKLNTFNTATTSLIQIFEILFYILIIDSENTIMLAVLFVSQTKTKEVLQCQGK